MKLLVPQGLRLAGRFIPSRELAKQAVITKCRDNINAEPSRAFIKYKAVFIRAKNKKSVIIKISLDIKIICANLCKSVDKKNSVDNLWMKKLS